MPIIWRSLLGQYVKVFCLSLFSFIAILLVTRLDEVAQYASLGAPLKLVALFALYQVLYILPIAIPIACLISSIILYQNLSHTRELTAMRSSGLSICAITAPVLIAASVLAFLNFYMVSEWATRSHLSSRQMVNEIKSINPLILLQNKNLLRLKDAYVEMGSFYSGEVANDVIIAIHNRNTQRINLINAKKLSISHSALLGEKVSFISILDSEMNNTFDHLLIENQRNISSQSHEFSALLKKSGWRLSNDHLQMPLLLLRTGEEKGRLQHLVKEGAEEHIIKDGQRRINRCYSEIARRFSAAIAAFTFTFMGTAFGIDISRRSSKKGTMTVIALAALFLMCFFAAKSYDYSLTISTSLYVIPHIIITGLSIWTLNRISKGVE